MQDSPWAILGPSWVVLGRFGSSWVVLGPSWGRYCRVLGPAYTQDLTFDDSFTFLTLFHANIFKNHPSWGHLGPSWGRLVAVLGCLGAVLGTSWAVLGHLEASWAVLGRLGDVLKALNYNDFLIC